MINSNKGKGRLAGFIFFILAITGIFAHFFVRQKLFIPGDTAGTAQNIIDNQWLFRLGFVSDLIMSVSFFFYTFILYIIFKSVSKNISLLMLLCTVISVAMYCQNMLNQFSGLDLLVNTGLSEAFSADQLQKLSTFYYSMHSNGYLINQIFYGMYLFPLGYMIYTSRLVPRIIGVFLMLGCIGDLIDFVVYFLFPDTTSVFLQNITIPADIGEISFCLWLMIMGVKEYKTN